MKKFILIFTAFSALLFSSCNMGDKKSNDAKSIKLEAMSDEYLQIYLGPVTLSKLDIDQIDISGKY